MKKVLVIGIDSLDPNLLSKFESKLPCFTRLRSESPSIDLESIFPIDSIPAWATVFTGLNPAKHGLIYSFDVFESSWNDVLRIDKKIFQGRTYWDFAGNAGGKVCILFPLVAYPAWEVNGTMVSRSLTGDIDTWPATVLEEFALDDLQILSGKHPGKSGLAAYAKKAREITLREAEAVSKILSTREWDLAYAFFGMLDIIQHFFWRYFDEEDPTYPGHNEYEDIVCNFYILIDNIVAQLLDEYPEAVVIVHSDHGHGMRPPKTVNLNEVLRQKGFLFSKGRKLNPAPYILETCKRLILDIVHRFEWDHSMLRLSKLGILSTITKDMYMSKSSIDMDRTIAYLSSFVGPKSYPYGGIEIHEENLADSGMDYETVRTQIIELLMELEEPETEKKLAQWACRREDLYTGPHIESYPDVVFELIDGYGIYWGVHTPLIGTAYEHNLASGGHKKQAVFLVRGKDSSALITDEMTLMDVAPTILHLLGVDVDDDFDGRSIFE
jgi:predicted AlkP superfamily phosphohydrolase/phosphomutase